jgi:GAF domain-containing protein
VKDRASDGANPEIVNNSVSCLFLMITGDLVKSVLCVPIVTPDGNCSAVIELYREITQLPFNKDDLKISIVVTGWVGAAIHQNHLRLTLQRQQELNDYLLDLTKCYFAETVAIEKMITEIVVSRVCNSTQRVFNGYCIFKPRLYQSSFFI